MSLCYFSQVSHYKRNAVFNIAAFIRFIENLLKDISILKKVKKQHFDIIVGKLRISFIEVMDETLTPSPWTTLMDYPKIPSMISLADSQPLKTNLFSSTTGVLQKDISVTKSMPV